MPPCALRACAGNCAANKRTALSGGLHAPPAARRAARARARAGARARAQAAALLTAAVLSSGALFAYHCAREQLALAALHPVALYSGLLALLVLPVDLLFRVRGRPPVPVPAGRVLGRAAQLQRCASAWLGGGGGHVWAYSLGS